MTKKQSSKPSVVKHEISGHRVEIRKFEDKEQLWIDGVLRKFFVTPDGYNLRDDAYVSPHKSLIEAVESYLSTASQQPDS